MFKKPQTVTALFGWMIAINTIAMIITISVARQNKIGRMISGTEVQEIEE